MRTERPTCRECACVKVCEYFETENARNLDETCPLCNWENYFVPKQEWISVEERLPEEDGMYLVHHIGLSTDCIRITFFRKGEKYYDYMWKRYYSHWMPLPEAPKMKGGAEE